ncbi:hypothetical protein [Microlunatus sp. Gsoil 973]|uniref:hypothetical protein n=1 Tax=Microlunatus sp. Gsoil 973 TaxID=2672569 RepID=UPI0012B497F8|nr:hypothetical protein [Microlunatus sp. Gsoil 973]QGN34277.1 hypothetical protein GJV80_17245 [Microlunatus sp. Gsoil 973]
MVSEVTGEVGTEAGRRFAAALAGKQVAVLTGLLAPDVDFRGLTPGRAWEASDAAGVMTILLDHWFEPTDEIDELVAITVSSVADRQHVSYRLRGHNADGPFVVEQQMYYQVDTDDPGGDRIRWMRVLCSGFRPPGR